MEDPDEVTFTDDEIEMDEDLEAMLYSQIHHEYDYELQAGGSQNAGRLQATASNSSHTEQHVISVKSFSSEEHSTQSNHLQDTQKPVFDGFGSTGDIINVSDSTSSDESVVEISLSSKKSRGEDSSEVKSSEHDSDLHAWSALSSVNCDPNVLPQVQRQRNDMPKSVQVAESGRKETSDQTSLPDVICLDDSLPFSKDSKSKPSSKPKFDLESELGVPKQPVCKQRKPKQSDSDCEIDTITIKPKAKKISKAENFLKFNRHEIDLSVPKDNYKKPLRQILTSHSVSKRMKLNLKETFFIHSDGSSSSSGEDDSDCTGRTTSDSDDKMCDATSISKKKKSASSSNLDLNWNVTSTDYRTIKIIEKQQTQGDESKWRVDKADMKGSQMSRYYTKREITCNNCNKQGHLSKRCTEPKRKTNCGLCGESDHMMSRCVNRLCFNCNLPGHTGARCPAPRRDRFAKCPHCLMKGHNEDQCPDQWRQFHSTITTAKDLVPEKAYMNSRVWCSNCARKGHFVHECRSPLMDKFVFPTYPFIIRYDMASSTQSKNVPAGGSKTQVRGRHTKFISDSGLDDSPCCKKLKSSQSQDTHTHQASSSKHDRASDQQNVSTSHWLRSVDKNQSRPVYSQSLFPRGRSDKSSPKTWSRQQRYFKQSQESNFSWKNSHGSRANQDSHGRWQDSHELSASKRHACLGLEDLSITTKKPRINSEILAENEKKKAKPNRKARKKLRRKLGIEPEPKPNKKQRRKLRLEKRKTNQDLTPAKDKTRCGKQSKKLQIDKERTGKNLSRNAEAAGLLRKGNGRSPKRTGTKGGKCEESAQQPESRSPKKKKNKDVQSPRLKSPSQVDKISGKKKKNKKEGPKLSSIDMSERRHQSKRAQIAGLIPQCRSKSITTMSGFRSTFLASASIK